jgi:hypothetical protein
VPYVHGRPAYVGIRIVTGERAALDTRRNDRCHYALWPADTCRAMGDDHWLCFRGGNRCLHDANSYPTCWDCEDRSVSSKIQIVLPAPEASSALGITNPRAERQRERNKSDDALDAIIRLNWRRMRSIFWLSLAQRRLKRRRIAIDSFSDKDNVYYPRYQ